MSLPEFGVKRSVTVLMIFLAILILGAVSLSRLPIDLMPKIETPTISVITMYPGASAEDVEEQVTKVIEDRVAMVPHIKEVKSSSQEGLSLVAARFEWGTDLDEAANDIRQRLDIVERFLPEDIEKPMVVRFDFSMMPILFLGVTAQQSYPHLYQLVDDKLCDPLKRLPGVAMTVIIGGLQREIRVDLDRQRLEAYHLSVDRVGAILAAENFTLPAGDLKVGRIDYALRVPGEFSSVEEIEDVVVGYFNGAPVYLKDIARVNDSFKEAEYRTRVDRQPAVMVMVQKQSDANTVEVVRQVKQALPRITRKLPPDVKVKIIMDSSEFIQRSVYNLTSTVGWALLFVVLVVLFFLREPRGGFIIAITIPFSLIIAFIFLYAAGYTINMMSLSAIAIAIGMVVDCAIVVYENIYRHRVETGEPVREAAVFGSTEVGTAITASTLTTVAIFLPVVFVPGITGIMFKQLAMVVTIVLVASLFCALTLTPMLSAHMGHFPQEMRTGWFTRVEGWYQRLLSWALGHRKIVMGAGLGVFLASLLMVPLVGTEFIPTTDQGEVWGTVELPLGTRVEVTDQVMQRIEGMMTREVPEREVMFARCGASETGMETIMGRRSAINIISVGCKLVPKRERNRSDRDISYVLGRKVAQIPGVKTLDFTPQEFMQMGGGKPVEVEIYGHNLGVTDALALKVKEIMEGIPGLTDVTISRIKGRPELWVQVDRRKAAVLGLNMAQIANTLRTQFYGYAATQYREGGEEYDIFLRLAQEHRQSLADLDWAFVTSPLGHQIPLASIATVTEQRGPVVLERKNQERVVTVGAGLYGRSLGPVVKDLKRELSKLDIPEGVDIEIAGSAQDQAESFKYLLMALILGIVLVYMVMASQFESLIDPFVIMFSVPFAITGVIWALLITGKTLNIISYVGMIMLVGIVVNNAIVLVDYTNILRARGLGLQEAILTAGRRRLRPVLMTALTTIFALTPLALSTREGAEIWTPLGVGVIGGLLVSTLITLILVPTLYSIFEEKLRGKRIFGRRIGKRSL